MTARLDELPVDARLLVTRRMNGTGDAETLIAHGPSDAGPLGSVFKLFVLLATADAVAAGELSWDEELRLTDADRSLPSGTLQDQPTGALVSVREAASEMIAISDNTATDLLVRRLGREQIESAYASVTGETSPPWFTTKDLFALGWGDPSLRARFDAADTDERRVILAEIDAAPLDVDPTAVTNPQWQHGYDWYATPGQVAAVHEALHAHADTELRRILSRNPGLSDDLDRSSLPYVAFKGGSAPGVLAGSWLAETDDGAQVIVVLQIADADPAAVSAAQRDALLLAGDALRLAAD